MKTSLNGLIEIASHEGVVLSPYLDSVGVWTIFIGHTKAAGGRDPLSYPKGVAQTVQEAIETLRDDIKRVENRVNSAVKVQLSQHEFDALVSFDYNTGGIFRAKLTQFLNQEDRVGAAKAFDGWHKPPEIIGRRNKERELFKTGRYSSGGKVALYEADTSGKIDYRNGKQVNLLPLLTGQSTTTSPTPPSVQPTPPSESPTIVRMNACQRFLNSLLRRNTVS
jgi:lysozyme